MYPVCFESSPNANMGNRHSGNDEDLIITKQTFKPLRSDGYFKMRKMEVINIICSF